MEFKGIEFCVPYVGRKEMLLIVKGFEVGHINTHGERCAAAITNRIKDVKFVFEFIQQTNCVTLSVDGIQLGWIEFYSDGGEKAFFLLLGDRLCQTKNQPEHITRLMSSSPDKSG